LELIALKHAILQGYRFRILAFSTVGLVMNFAVEVPGEAAPLSLEELVRTLQAAQSSTNNAERVSAGLQLTDWYSHKSFLSSLQVGQWPRLRGTKRTANKDVA
jgi:hypothetical protein